MSPQILEVAFNRVEFDRELVFKFFIIFSLFENALKQTGFRLVNQIDDVQPDWNSFAQAINPRFTPQSYPELIIAIDYFLNNPPGKQVYRNNRLTFTKTQRPPNMCDTEWLSLLIRRVRNNLFHGGKFSYDRYRDTFLLQFSIVILESWVTLHSDVQRVLQNIQ